MVILIKIEFKLIMETVLINKIELWIRLKSVFFVFHAIGPYKLAFLWFELRKTIVLLLSYTFWRYFNLLWHHALQFYRKVVGSIVYTITTMKILYASSKCWHKMRKHGFLNDLGNNNATKIYDHFFFLLCNLHLLESIFWICFRVLSWGMSVDFSFIISSLSLLFYNSHKKSKRVFIMMKYWLIFCISWEILVNSQS